MRSIILYQKNMKKYSIFFFISILLGGHLTAQDTLWQKTAPLSHYYSTFWHDTTQSYHCTPIMSQGARHIHAKRLITPDTLQVYGIAAMMANEIYAYMMFRLTEAEAMEQINQELRKAVQHGLKVDSTLENCEESLLLFQYHGGDSLAMRQIGSPLPVHALHTIPAHWMIPNTPTTSLDSWPKPIYERYFPIPQEVYDTFYVGATSSCWTFSPTNHNIYQIRPTFDHMVVTNLYWDPYIGEADADLFQDDVNEPPCWMFHENTFTLAYIFPILTPEPIVDTNAPSDTTIVPINPADTIVSNDSTIAIASPEMLSQYISVSPNPAKGHAEVLSSFGLNAIEVFDTKGCILLTLDTTGHKATLDLTTWPSSTYYLRIHTPFGTTTKKLIVL